MPNKVLFKMPQTKFSFSFNKTSKKSRGKKLTLVIIINCLNAYINDGKWKKKHQIRVIEQAGRKNYAVDDTPVSSGGKR